MRILLVAFLAAASVGAAPHEKRQASSSSSSSASSTLVSTAVPSATGSASAPLTNYTIPDEQAWCAGQNGSQIFCPGRILQTVQLASLYPDSKTFVDKPTTKSEAEVVAAFDQLVAGGNATVEGLIQFVDENFSGEGLDLFPANLTDFVEEPAFLDKVTDPTLRAWFQIVHGYWRDLAKTSEGPDNCEECVSTLITLPNTFIVPGGRFRENYYWDTYWVLIGLLTGGLQTTANETIQNYLYLLEDIGFIPNGARIYYLNRSQPPLFTQMLHLYVTSTNDTSFLPRALRLVEVEMDWWNTNRTLNVTAPSGNTHQMYNFNVSTTAPRPESYLEDWEAVNGPPGGPYLNLSTDLYRELSSGAESGMDYSAGRWSYDPLEDPADVLTTFRTIRVTQILPVDLNAMMYRNYELLSLLYDLDGNSSRSDYWSSRAATLREAILDVHWDSEALLFKDFNITAGAQHNVWSTAAYWPYFSGIIPTEVLSSTTNAQKAFSGLAYITGNYNGSIPITLYPSGQQWDFASSWAPQTWVAMKALQALPANISGAAFSNYSQQAISYSYLPPNHFGGLTQGELPGQSTLDTSRNITNVSSFGQLGNVGNVTTESLGWRDGLLIAIANRFASSAFCTWYSTGGSIPGLLNRLPDDQLEGSGDNGVILEKYSTLDIDQAGSGGEYTVQAGFGWTNGVLAWIANNLGADLNLPTCPAMLEVPSANNATSMVRQLELRPKLAEFIAKGHQRRNRK